MTEPNIEVLGRIEGNATQYLFWCPGCECCHFLETKPGGWVWNGDMVKPSASPSLLVRSQNIGVETRCHFFVRGGQLQFLGDCSHDLAGETVDMVAWETAGIEGPR